MTWYSSVFFYIGESLGNLIVDVWVEYSPYQSLCQRIEGEFQYKEIRRVSCPPCVTGSIIQVKSFDSKPRVISLNHVYVYGSYGKTVLIYARDHDSHLRHSSDSIAI